MSNSDTVFRVAELGLQIGLIGLVALSFAFLLKRQPVLQKSILSFSLVLILTLPLLRLPGSFGWQYDLSCGLHELLTQEQVVASQAIPLELIPHETNNKASISEELIASQPAMKAQLDWSAWIPVAVLVVLLIGSLCRFVGVVQSAVRLRRIRKQAIPVAWPESLQDEILILFQSRKRELPRLCRSKNVSTPVACGGRATSIVLPSGFLKDVSDNQLRHVLLHESAHLLNRDERILRLQALANVLYWWHPILYLLNHRINNNREDVCDNLVLKSTTRLAYGETLLAVSKQLMGKRTPYSLAFPGIPGNRKNLLCRIQFLLDDRRSVMTSANPGTRMVLMSALFVFASVLAMGRLATVSAAPPNDDVITSNSPLVDQEETKNEKPSGENSGDKSANKPIPEWERWNVEFEVDSSDEYFEMLDSFGIYLGAISQTTDKIWFLSKMSNDEPEFLEGTRRSEKAQVLYFRSVKASEKSWEKDKLKEAGLPDDSSSIAVRFFPKEVRSSLLDLEVSKLISASKKIEDLQSVHFIARKTDGGYKFFVNDIKYRTKSDK